MSAEDKGSAKSRSRQRATPEQAPPGQPEESADVSQPGVGKWLERAAFHVAFDYMHAADGQPRWQTRVYHEESDDQAAWPGLARDALLEWMLRKSNAQALSAATPAAPDMPSASAAPAPRPAVDIAVEGIRLAEAQSEREVGGALPADRMRAEIVFRVLNLAPELADVPRCYAVQLLAYDTDSGSSALLAAGQQPLISSSGEYAASVEFDLPPLGRYQTMALILLIDLDAVGVAFGPVLAVVP